MNGDPTTSWTDRERRKTWQRQREREKGRGRLGFSALNETKSDRKGKQAGRQAGMLVLPSAESRPSLPSFPHLRALRSLPLWTRTTYAPCLPVARYDLVPLLRHSHRTEGKETLGNEKAESQK